MRGTGGARAQFASTVAWLSRTVLPAATIGGRSWRREAKKSKTKRRKRGEKRPLRLARKRAARRRAPPKRPLKRRPPRSRRSEGPAPGKAAPGHRRAKASCSEAGSEASSCASAPTLRLPVRWAACPAGAVEYEATPKDVVRTQGPRLRRGPSFCQGNELRLHSEPHNLQEDCGSQAEWCVA